MKVLVTGHLGYIGTVMVPFLLRAGHDVTGCDSDLYERCTFDAGGHIEAVPALRKDIRDLTPAELEGFVVQPCQRVAYEVTADALGHWAYHCHLLYHMEAGMFREVVVA
jgi:FtsP/CotA-like multicopper oxidase with cupredoxin domain